MVTFSNRYSLAREHISGNDPVALDHLPSISPETIRRGEKLVEAAGTGWSYRAIREQFTRQLVEGFKPDNVNAAFIGFVKKKVRNRTPSSFGFI
jgi:hypothetical protein